MLKNSSPQTTPEVKAGQGKDPAPPASPTTLGDAGRAFSKYTLGTPNKYMPKWMTGALPRTLLTSGVLGLLGSQLAPSILGRLVPGSSSNPKFQERSGRAGIVGGALLGLLLNSPDLYSSFQSARGIDAHGKPGHWSQGFKGLTNGWDNIPKTPGKGNFKPIWNDWFKDSGKKSSVKTAGFWNNPSIDAGAMGEATRRALYEGRIDPTAMLQAQTTIDMADKNSWGNMSPGSLGAAVAGTALKAGVGAGLGLATGKVVGAMGGAFGLLSPSSQRMAETGSALAGAIANVLTGASSFK